MNEVFVGLNHAAIQRQLQALTAQLRTLTTSKALRTPALPPGAPGTAVA